MIVVLRKILSDSFVYAVLPRISRVLSILIMPIITKYLTPYDYGITGILFAYIHVFEGFRNLGLDVVFINSFFKDNDNYQETWAKIFGFLTLWAIPYGLLLIPVAYIAIPAEIRTSFFWIVLFVVFPIICFDHTVDVGQKFLQINRKPIPFSVVALASALVVLASNYVTIVHYRMGFLGFIVSDFIGKLVTFAYYFTLVFLKLRLFPRFDYTFPWLKEKLAVAIPTIPHAYAGYILNTSDRVLLSLFSISVSSVGLYTFAYSFGTHFSKLGQSILVAGRPIIMGMFAEENRESEVRARNLIWLLQAGLLTGGFVLSLWIKEIIGFLASNNELHNAFEYAIPVIMAYTYYPIYIGAINKLYYLEKTKVFWKISLFAALINLGLNLLLIPKFGVWGAAITTFISYLYMGYSAYFLKEFRKPRSVKYRELAWLFATCIITIAVFAIKSIDPMTKFEITALLLLGWLGFWIVARTTSNSRFVIPSRIDIHD